VEGDEAFFVGELGRGGRDVCERCEEDMRSEVGAEEGWNRLRSGSLWP
jgi:hypothetical protein